MIKKTLLWLWISLFSLVGFSFWVSLSWSLWDGTIDKNLNFNPNPLVIPSGWTNCTRYYWWVDWEMYLWQYCGPSPSPYNHYVYWKVLFSFNWSVSTWFYDLVKNWSFVPVSYSIDWEGIASSSSTLTFYDNSWRSFSSSCGFSYDSNRQLFLVCYWNNLNVVEVWSDLEFPINNSPFWWWGWWSVNNNYLCPTVWQLLNTYWSEYNTWLCYSSSLIMSWWSVVSVSPQSIFDLFPTQSDFVNYRQLYSNYCSQSPVAWVSSSCSSAFQWKDIEYTLIAKIPWSINSLSLYSYCNLALNQDPNTSTCVASGVYNTGVSRQDVINSIVNWDYQVVIPSSWSITSDVIWSWNYFDWDIFWSIQSIYTKFTSFFTTQTWNIVWILPWYIIAMLLVIILFRLFKK